ncbi:MAG: hypothetical protein ACYDAC_02295 [Candidatus Dormibacteria bacterium]
MDGAADAAGLGGSGGLLANVVTVDGRAVGTWQSTHAAGAVSVRIRLLGDLSRRSRRLLGEAADRYGDFLGASPRLVIL